MVSAKEENKAGARMGAAGKATAIGNAAVRVDLAEATLREDPLPRALGRKRTQAPVSGAASGRGADGS